MPGLLKVVFTTFVLAAGARAADVTIVVNFDGPYSPQSLEQMKRETASIVKDSGLRLDWRQPLDFHGDTAANLVVLRFKGNCVLDPGAHREASGPFAITHSSDGQMLPFSEVVCDRVAASVQPALWGDDFARPDYLMGRALGRVVAHELLHILTGSSAHGADGVGQTALSGSQLIGAPLRLSRSDVERLRRGFAGN
jgi:hypothetical protein